MNTTPAFELILECSHLATWREPPGAGGGPYFGLVVFCDQCSADSEIVKCEPRLYDIKTITRVNRVTIFYDARTGTWGYHVHGIGKGGDVVTGFVSAREAEEVARGIKIRL